MPSPFPGMDPWLEHPACWPGFHNKFISEMQTLLNEELSPRYVVDLEERVYIVDVADDDKVSRRSRVPDLTVSDSVKPRSSKAARLAAVEEPIAVMERLRLPMRELYLEIRETPRGRVLTVIEVLSPTNKAPGTLGRREYLRKRRDVMQSKSALVEIDLLRAGRAMIDRGNYEYHALVSEPGDRSRSLVWPVKLNQTLPRIPVPLVRGEKTVLDLQNAFTLAYDRGGYGHKLDYSVPSVPPLPKAWWAWARKLTRE